MSASLPNRSVRIAPEHGDVLKSVVALLRAGREQELRSVLSDLEKGGNCPVGAFRNAEAALSFLLGRLVAAGHPQSVWLFGSRARGGQRTGSDFDLLAIRADDAREDLEDWRNRMADSLAGAGLGVDLAVCTAAEFQEFRDVAGSLIRTVHEKGRELYVAPAERRRRKAAAV